MQIDYRTVEQLIRIIYEDPVRIDQAIEGVRRLVETYRDRMPQVVKGGDGVRSLDRTSSLVITYGDSLLPGADSGETPLARLRRFADEHLEGVVSGLHILPFAPYSSDDGFSVVDYRQVNPELGSWEDVRAIAESYDLMADLVLNHCSAQSAWFRSFLADEEPYNEYFITVEEGSDVSGVFRPRALPLLTPFDTVRGTELIWTTFSPDQVDLNFASPKVLTEMLDVFLFYLEAGVRIVRLDAIAYLWKELGTPCLHHPKTHAVVRLFRAVAATIAPGAIIITETNVPHRENISYFGNDDEAHMVYQFSLPPLTADALIREDASHLRNWAAELPPPSHSTTFFNFCASHDGVGVLPARGYLSETELEQLVTTVEERGGRVSYKATPTGDVPYELNVNYLSAVAPETMPPEQRARAFLASQAILLSLAGVPGIYIHSLLGSTNWYAGVEQLGYNRAINREKLDADTIEDELSGSDNLRALVFEGYRDLLQARRSHQAFSPSAQQRVLSAPGPLWVILRGLGTDTVLCITNVSHEPQTITLREHDLGELFAGSFRDLISDDVVATTREDQYTRSLGLDGYETVWLAGLGDE